MPKQVQQFISRVSLEIRDRGLRQMSAIRFDRGDTPMDALRYFAARGSCTVGEAAESLNAMNDFCDVAEGRRKQIFRKRLNSGSVPKKAKYLPMVIPEQVVIDPVVANILAETSHHLGM